MNKMKDRICKYCSILFENIEGRLFSNHVRWCDKNTSNGDKGRMKASDGIKKHHDVKLGEKKIFDVFCDKCKKTFQVKEREKRHPERKSYFCSRSCANYRGPRSEDIKNRVSEKLKGRFFSPRSSKSCLECQIQFHGTINKIRDKKFCSQKCSKIAQSKTIDKDSLKYYRQRCDFQFSLSDYPEEFDFSLVEKLGWYSAKNHGDNMGGVSRDHIVSVRYGFDNKIDPKIISHPANCRLLPHNQNVSKGSDNGMSIDDLLIKIDAWNAKYPVKTTDPIVR